MKKLIFFSAIALLIFATMSCEKEELPEATRIGANTLGCKINGKPFTCTRKKTTQGIPIPGIDIGISKNILRVKASTYSERHDVAFYVEYDRGVGKYTNIKNVVEGTNSYVEITRFSNDIISGYFEITLREFKIPLYWKGEEPIIYDTIITKYTEGRFDVQL